MATTEQIKELRAMTGVSVMQCKKALDEAGDDMEKAHELLLKKSKEAAAKKSDRSLGAGVVEAYIHNTKTVGALVELSCETDFVANNEEFQKLAYDIAMHITASSPEFLKREDVSEEEVEKAKVVFKEDVDTSKPADIQEKILSGKLDAYFAERTLLEQKFIKDPEKTIGDLVNEAVQKFGERTELTRFERFAI